jgi:hypothetical protein
VVGREFRWVAMAADHQVPAILLTVIGAHGGPVRPRRDSPCMLAPATLAESTTFWSFRHSHTARPASVSRAI